MSRYSVTDMSTRFFAKLFFCYYAPHLTRYFWRPTGRLAGTKREFATNAVLTAGLSGFNSHRRENRFPWNI